MGSSTFVSPLFPCISAQMPLLVPLVDWAKAARAAVGTRGYACPDGLGCTDLAAHPDTKVAIRGAVLKGGAGRGAGRGSSGGRVRWKGPLKGDSGARRGSGKGSSKGF